MITPEVHARAVYEAYLYGVDETLGEGGTMSDACMALAAWEESWVRRNLLTTLTAHGHSPAQAEAVIAQALKTSRTAP